MLALAGILGTLMVISTALGAVWISPGEILSLLARHLRGAQDALPGNLQAYDIIIFTIRLPRVLLGALVGAGLALSGAVFQGLFRNPMADPFVIGISSGAALGAVLAIMAFNTLRWSATLGIPGCAFAFAVFTIILVYRLAQTGGKVPVMTLLLAGIAVNSFLSALVSLCMFYSGSQMHQVVFWLMGGFSNRGWDHLMMFIPYATVGALIVLLYTRELNAMLMGEESAQHLGIEVEKVKFRLLVAAALLTGACVSVSGLIGFVGLITPHIVRLLCGPNHRVMLPLAAMAGAIFMVAADVVARVIIAPQELPVGIVTALVGGPFFIYLLRRQKATGGF
ncbi:MAG TPA: iron chelate uptake ABC transporter family permease subunit [Syntrophomonadaceae bacterium]|nr:iron chelate uptake ABC transporter family permease subunit [Syntrophomonadaceae bacterium]